MTTVTVITGTVKSGRPLIAKALMGYIAKNPKILAVVVMDKGKTILINGREHKMVPKPEDVQDLILVSGSTKIETWMKPFIKRYGDPLFHIHSHRMRE